LFYSNYRCQSACFILHYHHVMHYDLDIRTMPLLFLLPLWTHCYSRLLRTLRVLFATQVRNHRDICPDSVVHRYSVLIPHRALTSPPWNVSPSFCSLRTQLTWTTSSDRIEIEKEKSMSESECHYHKHTVLDVASSSSGYQVEGRIRNGAYDERMRCDA